jgi:glycosyltransferase involved in cell wall biosynthesis
MRLSIVINNYNYAAYIREAIDSALNVEYADKEVIVIDDGSTDHSPNIIASYGDAVKAVFKENGGQNSAANLAFAHVTGDSILFLDADDRVLPTLGRAVSQVWRNGVAKVQFGQYHIDGSGRRLGTAWPRYSPYDTPERIRRIYERTGFYDTPPTSGNVWSREFLDQVFPLPTRDKGVNGYRGHTGFFDDYLHMLAPFFGDVVSLPEPQGEYRLHSASKSGVADRFSLVRIANVCEDETARVHAVNELLHQKFRIRPGAGIDFTRNWDHMHHRLIYRRLLPERYPYRETLLMVFFRFMLAVHLATVPWRNKLVLWGWGTLVAFAPKRLALWVARMLRYKEERRNFLRRLSSLIKNQPVGN